jgi:citrate lyase subunit beta/citryl-CoA lyase
MAEIFEKKLIWRSMLYVPSNNLKFIKRANQRGADAIILDLEDSVPHSEKNTARCGLGKTTQTVKDPTTDVLVRINRPLTDAVPDIQASVIEGVSALMLPKIDSPEHVKLLEEVVEAREAAVGLTCGTIKFVPMIETASGYFRMKEIAAASTRNIAITLGGEDFAFDNGLVPDEETLLMASQKLVYAARAAGIVPLGTIGTVAEFTDLKAYSDSAFKSQKFGFEGAACIHPSVIEILNTAFTPNVEEVSMALRIVEGYRDAIASGKGAITIDGKMIDIPVAHRAQQLLNRYENIKKKA